jgi:glycosyltransferase involved in cell wall biosynthesis
MRRPGVSEDQSISACLLCYNDAATIGSLVARGGQALDELGADGEIIVVDDGSADDSLERLAEARAREPRLRVVEHARNRGYGGALRSALGAARCDWVFYTDGDNQYDPIQLVRLAERAGPDVDWVQGYKRLRSDTVGRRVVGSLYGTAMGFLFGLPIRDVDCDFRLMRAEIVRGLRLDRDSGAICVELVRGLRDAGARCVEVEVDHFERLHGRSQFFQPRRILFSLMDVAALWIRLIARPALSHVLRRDASARTGRGGPGARGACSPRPPGARARSAPGEQPPRWRARARTGSRD